jgi:hypothetical protein
MITDSLFDQLDLNHDGHVSRSELHAAATRLGWHWSEAPILALLDLLTIPKPISHQQFTSILQQIQEDPLGPYGKVLLNAPVFSMKPQAAIDPIITRITTPVGADSSSIQQQSRANHKNKNLPEAIENKFGKETATDYHRWLNTFAPHSVATGDAALLIIDPQRSFTKGVWMQSIGDGAAIDVEPIVIAFNNCRGVLDYLYGRMEIMFSRCPFPPGSYDWDDRLVDIIDRRQLYFIKPGNSVVFPPFNGFKQWTGRCIDQGIKTLVIGGCTLNSCVRVSAIEIQQMFKSKHLQVVVDLSICGARLRNYLPSPLYGEVSAVASAVSQMAPAGVQVVRRVEWSRF